MEYIKSLSVVQKIALIATPLVALNAHLFGLSFKEIIRVDWWGADQGIYFTALAVCVAVYFLFPQKQSAG